MTPILMTPILYFIYIIPVLSQHDELIYLPNTNYIHLSGEIEPDMANEIVSELFDQDDDFYMYIDSNGGCVESGLKIVKMMKYLQTENIKIKCIADKAFSMAFHIYQRCSERLFMSNTILMQHEMKLYINGNIEDSNKLLTKYTRLNDEIISYDSTRLIMDKNEYIKHLKHELWFSGQDIIKHNVGDRQISLII